MKTRLLWTEKTIFSEIFEGRAENNSLKKIYYISAIDKQADSFVEVACNFFCE